MKQVTNTPITEIKNRLSVQISLTGLSFLVISANDIVLWEHKEKWLHNTASPSELLERIVLSIEHAPIKQDEIGEIKVFYHTPLYTIVPTELIGETELKEFLKFNIKTLAHDFIAQDAILEDEAQILYIPYININNYFFEKFGGFSYYHSIGKWIDYCRELSSENHQVFANFDDKILDIVVLKDKQLILANSFEYRSKEDALYYILFTMEQLELDVESVPLILSGAIETQSDLYEYLYQYIRYIEFINTEKLKIKQIKSELAHKNLFLKLSV